MKPFDLVGIALRTPLFLLAFLLSAGLGAVEQPIKSDQDPRSYRLLELDNGLRVLLVSHPGADKAAASLEVGVGSGADPADWAGLAHFLEHMLFLGTDKYPEAGAYQAFIERHGGRHNAFTAYDRTNYFFDIDARQLAPALDRFARFFVAPLFNPDYVSRERNAVHSEFQSKLRDDGRRFYAAFKQVLNSKHPLAGFAVGNRSTLPEGPELQEALETFYRRHYRAKRMTLAIQGPQSLDSLESLARSRFDPIKAGDPVSAPTREPLFTPGTLPAQLDVASIKETYQLSLSFPVPPVRDHWRTKPLVYLASLVGDEGPGSLLQLLRERGWANALSAGPGLNHEDSASFRVDLELTPQGFQSQEAILALFFAYVERIRGQGIQDWRFAELKRMGALEFRFAEPGEPLHEVLRLATRLRRYPAAEVLRGDQRFAEFDADLIGRYLDRLTPDNLLLGRLAPELETEQKTPYFQAPYRLSKLSSESLAQLQTPAQHPDLALPTPNPFLPENLKLKPLPAEPSPRPEPVLERAGLRLWHQLDADFRVPRANFYVSFRSPLANDSVRHQLMTRLYLDLVSERLTPPLYPARQAGFRTRLYPHQRGFSLRIEGFSDKTETLLEPLAREIASARVDPKRFAIMRERLRRELQNRLQAKPYERAFDRLRQNLFASSWPIAERLAALENIDVEALAEFAPRLLARGRMEALAHGNLSREEAQALGERLWQHLGASLEPEHVPAPDIRILEPGSRQLEVAVAHEDQAVVRYYQGAAEDLHQQAAFALLERLLSAPFYTHLRTELQRGYIVFSNFYRPRRLPGLALAVQSPDTSPKTLFADFDRFLAQFSQQLESLTPEALEGYRQGLLNEVLKKEQKLSERSGRYWRELDLGYLDYDRRQQMAEALKALTLEDLEQLLQSLKERQLDIIASANEAMADN